MKIFNNTVVTLIPFTENIAIQNLYSIQIHDIMECRIDATLDDMASTALCDLPEERPITCEEFLEKTERTVAVSSERFVSGSDFVERAVFEIIDVCLAFSLSNSFVQRLLFSEITGLSACF